MIRSGVGKDLKLQRIIRRAFDLGLRTPSEPTLKLMASLWMTISETPETLANLDGCQKSANLNYTKYEFDLLRRRDTSEPIVWWDSLPTPLEFLNQHPVAFKQIFQDCMPIPPTDQLASVLMQVDVSYGCRGGGQKRQQVSMPQCNSSLQRSASAYCRLRQQLAAFAAVKLSGPRRCQS